MQCENIVPFAFIWVVGNFRKRPVHRSKFMVFQAMVLSPFIYLTDSFLLAIFSLVFEPVYVRAGYCGD